MKIVKFYTLFNFQDIVFSSTYLTRISEIRECPLPPSSKRASELVLEQKDYDPITDIISITPFFTADIRVWKI